jgi:cation:H+ antiporter
MRGKHLLSISIALLCTMPGIFLRLAGIQAEAPLVALFSGVSIMGASFLLLWACDAAQTEVSQSLALAAVALIAVLPEYSVDMYFTWQAGRNPQSAYSHYAIANMTGANRLLIGVAWGLIAVLCWIRYRKDVHLEGERRTELLFLGLASAYAFAIPLKGTLAWYDAVVFIGIYIMYLIAAGRRPPSDVEVEGPALVLTELPKRRRRAGILLMFLFAGFVILLNAGPFCEGLIATGRMFHVSEFLLVQWLAPVASEAPEFVVALGFAWRGQAGMALGSLLSAKLNQWTLLVGMIPGVFAVAHQSLDHPIPMGSFQMSELLLTAAQSLLAVVLLAAMRLSPGGALLLFGLFIGQFILPMFSPVFPGLAFGLGAQQVHPVFTLIYVAIAAALFLLRPRPLIDLVKGLGALKPSRRG